MFVPRGYTHGIVTSGGDLIFVSGQSGRDKGGVLVGPSDLVAQTRQALNNVRTVVEAGGGACADIVRLGVQVTDMAAYLGRSVELAVLFRAFFGERLPAMSLCEVVRFMDPAVAIEIDGIAVVATGGTT